MPPAGRRAIAAGGLAGATLVALSVVVMAHRYSDPYNGALFWPHALALTASIGFALVLISVALARPSQPRG